MIWEFRLHHVIYLSKGVVLFYLRKGLFEISCQLPKLTMFQLKLSKSRNSLKALALFSRQENVFLFVVWAFTKANTTNMYYDLGSNSSRGVYYHILNSGGLNFPKYTPLSRSANKFLMFYWETMLKALQIELKKFNNFVPQKEVGDTST